MNFADICQMALRNLQQAKLRAALTITGVVVGVTSLVCMVSFALGLQENLLNQTLSGFDIFTTIPVSGASLSMLLELGKNSENPDPDEGGDATAPGPPPAQRRHGSILLGVLRRVEVARQPLQCGFGHHHGYLVSGVPECATPPPVRSALLRTLQRGTALSGRFPLNLTLCD